MDASQSHQPTETGARRLSVLPADLHPLILEQLVEAISLLHPPHYEHLRTAALVCKDWAKMAQRLMWEEV
ncbi:hypothetical protein JCM10213_008179 [Rhodosporidiobolus nylandii]